MERSQLLEMVSSDRDRVRLSSEVQLSSMEMPSKALIAAAVPYALGMTEALHPDSVRVGKVPVIKGLIVSTIWI